MLHDSHELEPKSYRLPNLSLVRKVFDAAFRNATSVKGAFGWFDAGWIGVLAYGLDEYLDRDDTQPIEFTIAPSLFSAEQTALENALSGDGTIQDDALDAVIAELDQGASPASTPVTRHSVQALCWMVVNDHLRLNVAFPRASSNYHPKVWLFEDGQDAVVIRGSANATRRGMSAGIEHLDVDASWRDRYRVAEYRKMVLDWAVGADDMLIETVRLDLDLLKHRIQILAQDVELNLQRPPSREDLDSAITFQRAAPERAAAPTFHIPSDIEWQEGRFSHQAEAVDAWEGQDRRGIFSIATGGGKTVAAMICAQRSWAEQVERGSRSPLIIIVSAPTRVLIRQWDDEMQRFGLEPVLPTLGSKTQRRETLGHLMTTLGTEGAPDVVPIVVTNHRMAEPAFQKAIQMGIRRAEAAGKEPYVLHIGDEAHTLGARGFIENTPNFINERLGLSATPIRKYDEEGSEALLRYFGDPSLDDPEDAIIYEFSLSDAIACGALVPYEYFVDLIYLDEEEMREYRELTTQIGRKIAVLGGLDSSDQSLTALLIKRRSILEAASGKLGYLRDLLRDIDPAKMLLYTSSKNPEQFVEAHQTLHDLSVTHRQVTQETTSRQDDLDRVIKEFRDGQVDCLIAKKILDEGVNLPATRTAVLLASSNTEREWVQRLGRVLRKVEGKDRAAVYDVLALPPPDDAVKNDDTSRKLVASELERVRRIAACSQTQGDILDKVWKLEAEYLPMEDQ